LGQIEDQAVKQVSRPVAPIQVEITPEPAASATERVYKLVRKEFRDDGIFSELYNEKGELIAHTLEHSYDKLPKIPNGQWKCVRGPHRLHGMTEDFITFEITGIAGHTDLLFHWGNFNKDSEGCVLLGTSEATGADGAQMVTASRPKFAEFMAGLEGVNQFLVVVS
jgi:hypothetical protein